LEEGGEEGHWGAKSRGERLSPYSLTLWGGGIGEQGGESEKKEKKKNRVGYNSRWDRAHTTWAKKDSQTRKGPRGRVCEKNGGGNSKGKRDFEEVIFISKGRALTSVQKKRRCSVGKQFGGKGDLQAGIDLVSEAETERWGFAGCQRKSCPEFGPRGLSSSIMKPGRKGKEERKNWGSSKEKRLRKRNNLILRGPVGRQCQPLRKKNEEEGVAEEKTRQRAAGEALMYSRALCQTSRERRTKKGEEKPKSHVRNNMHWEKCHFPLSLALGEKKKRTVLREPKRVMGARGESGIKGETLAFKS